MPDVQWHMVTIFVHSLKQIVFFCDLARFCA